MLIQRRPTAVKTLSVRTDLEAFEAIRSLSEAISVSLSTLLRLAISDLLIKQEKIRARSLTELMGG
jgi:post-segregation antitoxin (ccd killing protein)